MCGLSICCLPDNRSKVAVAGTVPEKRWHH
jgi:hypothetical protein